MYPRALVLSVLVHAACATPSSVPAPQKSQTAVRTSSTAPSSLHPLDGAALKASLKDQGVVLVNAWGVWCQPCIEEMPMLLKLGRTHRSRGLTLVLVSMDPPNIPAQTLAQYRAWQAPGPWYVRTGSDEAFIEAWDASWSGTLPATWLFKNGQKIEFWEGEVDWATLTPAVESALRASP